MDAFYARESELHRPAFFMLRGRPVANEERQDRAARLIAGLDRIGVGVTEPPEADGGSRTRVHTERYLTFLREAWPAWQALSGAGPEVIANVQPRDGASSYPDGVVGRAGWHMGDLACPLGEGTHRAVCRSADCAVAGADAVERGGALAYALTRPPGHHASAEVAGGHCFLNNAAIAAAHLAAAGARPAVVDIDVHHGNGTQAIFYERDDVFTVSVHADPHSFYPWFTGHAHERGRGPGEGANRNLPLRLGADDAAWLEAIDEACGAAEWFGADALVLSLGLDVHESDPLSGFAVTTEGIARAGERVARAGLPAVVIQEGGYLSEALSDNVAAFFAGMLGAAKGRAA